MKSFNVICGLPRSGSTLLCNILNQNPEFQASSTSALPFLVSEMSRVFSSMPEVTSELIRDKEGAEARIANSMRGAIAGWYPGQKHVFDKGRSWAMNALLLKQLFPESLVICVVRDPRNVFASIEKQHRKNPILDPFNGLDKSIYARADAMFSPAGMLGGCILGVEDLIRRRLPGVHFLPYEILVREPEAVLNFVYSNLQVKPFQHDLANIVNTAEDVDALYLNKFEHKGSGPIVRSDPDEWKNYLTDDLAALILERYPFYNQVLGYVSVNRLNWNR